MGVMFKPDQIKVMEDRSRLDHPAIHMETQAMVGQDAMYVIGIVDHCAAATKFKKLPHGAEDVERLREGARLTGRDSGAPGLPLPPPSTGQFPLFFAAHQKSGQPPTIDLVHLRGHHAKLDAYFQT